MTEAEWLAASDPMPMLAFLGRRPSQRKIRWFCIACCQQILDKLDDPRERQGLLAAEQLADGLLNESGRLAVETALTDVVREFDDVPCCSPLVYSRVVADSVDVADASFCARSVMCDASYGKDSFDGIEDELRYDQVEYVRDIFGNPLRPVAFDPRWRTADTVGLARGIYEDRAFDRLPLLADTLLDAGCADEQMLGHCRSDGPHVRGCWVVDLVLGKE